MSHSRISVRFELVLLNSYHTRKTSALHKRTTKFKHSSSEPPNPQGARTAECKAMPKAHQHYGLIVSSPHLPMGRQHSATLTTSTPQLQSPVWSLLSPSCFLPALSSALPPHRCHSGKNSSLLLSGVSSSSHFPKPITNPYFLI